MKWKKNRQLEKAGGLGQRLARINGDPHVVSMGYAMGIFLAATPFIGLKVPIGILLAFLFKWNKVAAMVGIFHINPLTGPLYYGFSFVVGKMVLGLSLSYELVWPLKLQMLGELLTSNLNVFICLLMGGLVIGLPAALAAYFICRSFIRKKTMLKQLYHERKIAYR